MLYTLEYSIPGGSIEYSKVHIHGLLIIKFIPLMYFLTVKRMLWTVSNLNLKFRKFHGQRYNHGVAKSWTQLSDFALMHKVLPFCHICTAWWATKPLSQTYSTYFSCPQSSG